MLFGRKEKGLSAATVEKDIAASAAVQALDQAIPATSGGQIPLVPTVPAEEAKQRAAAARHLSATLGEIIALMMRTQEYRSIPLGEIEALVVPPLLNGHVSVATAQAKDTGITAPVGAVLWACVSPAVAKRLASRAGHVPQLDAGEWTSGDIVWVVASLGEGRVLSEMLKELAQRNWAGKEVRIVVRPKDGKPTVATLAVQPSKAA